MHETFQVAEVPSGLKRPQFSVMIPTFNCAGYLRRTLESVLAQDPGPDQMQIEVIDDRSTADNPEAVVAEVGKGRVEFYRKTKNEGSTANFNTCIERSRGRLVHILHGDDYVQPGFYTEFEFEFKRSPDCAGVFCRALVVDEHDELKELSPYVSSLKHGSNDPREVMTTNHLRTPAAVIRRSFYEEHGGFDPTLRHVADWDMWVRTIVQGKAKMINRALASYRWHANNTTSRAVRTGGYLRNYASLGRKWEAQRIVEFDRRGFEETLAETAFEQWEAFYRAGDLEAVKAINAFLREYCSSSQGVRVSLRQAGRRSLITTMRIYRSAKRIYRGDRSLREGERAGL